MLVLVGACWTVSECVVVVVVAAGMASSVEQEEKTSAQPAISGSKGISVFIMLDRFCPKGAISEMTANTLHSREVTSLDG